MAPEDEPAVASVRRRTLAMTVVAIVLAAAAVVAVATRKVPSTSPPATPMLPVLAPGSAAPSISAPRAGGGAPVRVGSGAKAVVLNFFASWCLDCRADLRELAALQARDVQVIGVDVEDGSGLGANPELAAAHARYPVALDPTGAIERRYRIDALPATVFIRPGGRVQAEVFGPLGAARLRAALATLQRDAAR